MFINMYALLPLMLRHGRAALTAMVIPCPQLHMNSIKRAHKDIVHFSRCFAIRLCMVQSYRETRRGRLQTVSHAAQCRAVAC